MPSSVNNDNFATGSRAVLFGPRLLWVKCLRRCVYNVYNLREHSGYGHEGVYDILRKLREHSGYVYITKKQIINNKCIKMKLLPFGSTGFHNKEKDNNIRQFNMTKVK